MDDHNTPKGGAIPADALETHVSEAPDGGVKPPRAVAAMAASVGGRAIAWRTAELSVTIVMEDGRKMVFDRETARAEDELIPEPTPHPRPLSQGERGEEAEEMTPLPQRERGRKRKK